MMIIGSPIIQTQQPCGDKSPLFAVTPTGTIDIGTVTHLQRWMLPVAEVSYLWGLHQLSWPDEGQLSDVDVDAFDNVTFTSTPTDGEITIQIDLGKHALSAAAQDRLLAAVKSRHIALNLGDAYYGDLYFRYQTTGEYPTAAGLVDAEWLGNHGWFVRWEEP